MISMRVTLYDCMVFFYSENTKNECQEMIENLKKAWTLVGQKLKNHSKLCVYSA